MENLKAIKDQHEAATKLVEEIKEELATLEKDVLQTSEEIKELSNQINNQQDDEVIVDYSELDSDKTVEELMGVEVLEDNKRRMEVDGELVEFETRETKYEKADNLTDEEIAEAFGKYKIEAEHYTKLNREDQIVLINYFREREALIKEMAEVNKKFESEMQELSRKHEKELLEGTKREAIEALQARKDLYLKYDKKQPAQQIQNIIDELEMSLSLDVMKKTIKNIKNHTKIIERFESDLPNAHKKFYTKLRKTPKTKFIYRENLENDLIERFGLTEFNAKLFMYLFYGFARNEKIVNQYSILINEIIKNISTQALTEEEKVIFRNSILDIVAIVCE